MMSLLVLDDIKVHFGGVKAVDGVSFSVEPGQICGVIGPNGSGKTTTLNAVTRAYRLTSGSVTFDGERIDGLPAHQLARRGLTRTFQGIRLIPQLTVRANIQLAAEQVGREGLRRSARSTSASVTDEVIERLALQRVASELPSALPYGTQRRVEIARALAARPKLVLLDEPVAGMSQSERDEIAQLLAGLRDSGVSLLVIEHDLKMLLELADHMVVLNFGRLLARGTPHETARRDDVRRAYLGDANVLA
jgi:ABC-type branched-subunit amino acid transport system ATPase component